jgi:hypothetical protein
MQFDLSSKRQSFTEWVSLNDEQRVGIHPLFKSIEGYKCSFFYNQKFKCFWVDHHYDENTGKFDQSILSNIPSSIVDDVLGELTVV